MENPADERRMRYTQGRRGPESLTRFTIVDADYRDAGGGMATGHAIAHLKKGDRDVRYLVQGRNYHRVRDRLVRDAEVVSKARWTGREAVTLTGAAPPAPLDAPDARKD